MRFSSDIQELVSRREKGKSLEAPFYNAPEILDLDIEVIFNRHWIFVAVEPELPEPGDCITVEVGRASILLLRGSQCMSPPWGKADRRTRHDNRQYRVPLSRLDL
jgi:Rieske 2Fe-2S family protein